MKTTKIYGTDKIESLETMVTNAHWYDMKEWNLAIEVVRPDNPGYNNSIVLNKKDADGLMSQYIYKTEKRYPKNLWGRSITAYYKSGKLIGVQARK